MQEPAILLFLLFSDLDSGTAFSQIKVVRSHTPKDSISFYELLFIIVISLVLVFAMDMDFDVIWVCKKGRFCDAVDVFEAMPEKNIESHNAILSLYLGIDDFMSARKEFDKIDERNIMCWNAMINGYMKEGKNSLLKAGYGRCLLYTTASVGDLAFVQEVLERSPLLVFGESEYGVADILYIASRSKSCDLIGVLLYFAIIPMFLVHDGEEMDKHIAEDLAVKRHRRLTCVEKLTRATIKKLTHGMVEHNKAFSAASIISKMQVTSIRKRRKTTNGDNLIWALTILGFEDYIEPLKGYLIRYRERDTKGTSGVGDTSARKDLVGGHLVPVHRIPTVLMRVSSAF
ncbi:Nuclear transcription factor Y subunit B-1 [Capsicum annuum]|nr:Nuclear transcription factor Y subunit B-1 [Capsicum annuum]